MGADIDVTDRSQPAGNPASLTERLPNVNLEIRGANGSAEGIWDLEVQPPGPVHEYCINPDIVDINHLELAALGRAGIERATSHGCHTSNWYRTERKEGGPEFPQSPPMLPPA